MKLTTVKCPRCRAGLIAQQDRYSSYLECLICGYAEERDVLAQAVAAAETHGQDESDISPGDRDD